MPSESKFNKKLTFMPLTEAGAILATAGISSLSNLLGVASQADANRTNLKIARENQAWQSAENRKSRDFQQSLFNQTNAYNTPAATMQRYRDAGLNPFVADLDKVGSGATQPAAPAMQSAPNPAHMESVFNGLPSNLLTAPIDYAFKKQQLDANIANQQAQTVNTIMDAAIKAARSGNGALAKQIVQQGAAQLGRDFDTTSLDTILQTEIATQQSNKRIKDVEASIAETTGMETAQQTLRNMKKEFDVKTKNIGLWDSLIALNNATEKLRGAETSLARAKEKREYSEIWLNKSKAKELVNRAYMEYAYGALAEAKTLSEDQLRTFFVEEAKLKCLELGIDYETIKNMFESQEFTRDFESSWFGKSLNVFQHATNKMFVQPTKNALGIFNDLPTLKMPKMKMKTHQGFMSPQGYKGYREWYEYE